LTFLELDCFTRGYMGVYIDATHAYPRSDVCTALNVE
jgi:hypothetical protein